MTKSVAAKMGIKEGTRALFVNASADALNAMDLPTLQLETKLDGDFDYIHFFVDSQVKRI